MLLASLLGCSREKPEMLDGPGMVYVDSDYRTEYANVLDFDSLEGHPLFAVAFLGYGEDRMEFRHTYVEGLFASLGDFAVEQVGHMDFDGDEWYLIIPRYDNYVDIKDLATGEEHTVYNGEPFTVKCNLSDLHPNIEISVDIYGGYAFSPQISGEGKLVADENLWDITDYAVMDENANAQE